MIDFVRFEWYDRSCLCGTAGNIPLPVFEDVIIFRNKLMSPARCGRCTVQTTLGQHITNLISNTTEMKDMDMIQLGVGFT